jgi:RNA polymerase sigma-70 factor, ECF subfamily
MRSKDSNYFVARTEERMPEESGSIAELEKERLANLSDEELVDLFLDHLKTDRAAAHFYFESIIARYQGLIAHIVRNSNYRFPAWDSADDVIARVNFKVYRGLALWRRQGKLSSFIARIATSEMIDTIRRVSRDKSYMPRISLAEPDPDMPSAIDRAPSKEPSPEARMLDREQRKIIDSLLEDVCRDWKDGVIVNEYIIGAQDAKTISAKYDMSEDLVYQRARRLRVRLIKWLADRGITSADQLLRSTRIED